jgi:ribose-phosphate pyrophosphokinase
MDAHNLAAFQSSVRYPVDHLEAKHLFADFLCGGTDLKHGHTIVEHIPEPLKAGEENLVVLSPDAGGLARAKFFRAALEARLNLRNKIEALALDKQRGEDGAVAAGHISGTVEGKKVIIYDDVIASGGTIKLCSDTVEKQGGEVWAVCASHFLPVESTLEKLSNIKRVVVTNTIPTSTEGWGGRLFVVKTEEIIAEAIRVTYYCIDP